MSQVLALASAVFFGLGDFAGGYITRRVSVWRVTLWSQVIGSALLVPGLLIVGWERVTPADLAWGVAAGLSGLIGLVVFYSTLAKGSISIVAPITGATGAAIPVLFDLGTGGSLTSLQIAGIVLALFAIVLVGADRSSSSVSAQQIWWAVGAGVAFALFFITLGQTSEESGLWPLVTARGASIPLAFAIALASGVAAPPRGRDLRIIGGLGSLDMAANITIAWSLQRGSLAVNSVLSSLYPAVTALLAVFVLHERPRPWQWTGIGAATLAVIMLAL